MKYTGFNEKINKRIAGKQTYYLKASDDADKQNNLFFNKNKILVVCPQLLKKNRGIF